jgi:iron complex outermembrane receptor protein
MTASANRTDLRAQTLDRRRTGCRLLLCLALAASFRAHAATVDLTTLSLEQLLKVTIVGASKYEQKQNEVAAAVRVVSRQEIKAFGWRTLNEALASLPGIHTTYDRQYSYLGTRGFGLPGDFNTRVLLSINGNRINDAVFDQAYLGRDFPLDLDLIERIEFIPGPGGAVYGQNAMFGVVNVVTRDGSALNGTDLAAGYHHPQSAPEGRVTWGRKLDNGFDVLLSASGYRAKGEDLFFDFGAAGAPGLASGMDGERDKEFFARLARGPWSFDFSYGDRTKDDPVGTYLSDPLTPGQHQRDRHLLTQLQYQDRFAGDTLHLSGRVFLGRERYLAPFVFGGAPTVQAAASDWDGAEMRLLSTAWVNHKIMLGIEYQANTRQGQTFEDATTPINNVSIPNSGWRAGAYAQDEWALGGALSATLGLRLDRNKVSGNALSPRVGLIWQSAPDTTWKALFGRARRAPNVFERDFSYQSQAANPALNGERIDTLELVVDHRVGQDLVLHGSIYRWTMRGLIALGTEPGSGLPQYQNGADVRASGAELSADKTWGWGGRLRGSVSYQLPRYDNGSELANSPRVLGKFNFSGPLASTDLRLGYELQYSSQRRAIDGTHLDGYWLSNLNLLADRWARDLEVSLGIYNLSGARYQHPGSRNNWQNALEQDGRSIRVKLSHRF